MRLLGRRSRRRVIVHFGFPKTGTTTIQNVLHAERQSLLDRDRILYPALSPNLTNALCTAFLENPLSHITNKVAGLSLDEARALGADYRRQLEEEFAAARWETLLLSAEGLSNLPADSLGDLRDWLGRHTDDISLVACVRDPIGYTASVIQQIMKGGPTLAELYEELPLPNYQGKLGNAIRAFGREQVRIYPFETAVKAEGGVVAEFARQVGVADERALELAAKAVRDNESLSEFGVMVLDGLNRIRPMFVDGVRNPRRSGRELAHIARLKGERYRLPPRIAREVRAQSQDDVAWLNSTFGASLYQEAPEPTAESGARPVTTQETALSVAAVIGDLMNPKRPPA